MAVLKCRWEMWIWNKVPRNLERVYILSYSHHLFLFFTHSLSHTNTQPYLRKCISHFNIRSIDHKTTGGFTISGPTLSWCLFPITFSLSTMWRNKYSVPSQRSRMWCVCQAHSWSNCPSTGESNVRSNPVSWKFKWDSVFSASHSIIWWSTHVGLGVLYISFYVNVL